MRASNSSRVDSILARLRYQNKSRVKQDVVELVSQIRTLEPREGYIMHNNGAESNLLVLHGTLPITYSNATYNIPVEIYITEPHPRTAPICYVRPTQNMTVKPGHKHVDGEGLVDMPYIREWNESTHTLNFLCASMMSIFGREPPVFAKPPAGASPPTPTATAHAHATSVRATAQPQRPPPAYSLVSSSASPPAYAQVGGNGHTLGGGGGGAGPFDAAGSAVGVSGTSAAAAAAAVGAAGTPGESPKERAVRQVTARLQAELKAFYGNICGEIDHEYARQEKLKAGRKFVVESIDSLSVQKATLEEQLKAARDSTHELDGWLTQRREAMGEAVDPDELIQPHNACSRKMLELVAEAGAIEDALLALDMGLSDRRIPLPVFLKEVRSLSRQQFLCYAHQKRILETQRGWDDQHK